MRVSAISAWVACEAMALATPSPEGRHNVAAWVGTLAHARLLGQPEPEPPARLRFDNLTLTAHHADVQAAAIAAEGGRALRAAGWEPMRAEVELTSEDATGHFDMEAWNGTEGRRAIIDLKTGLSIGAGWVQVGGYLALAGATPQDAPAGGILHVRRLAFDKEMKAILEIRPGGGLVRAWEVALARQRAVLGGALPTRSPGQHCARCPDSGCPVRLA